LVFCDPSEAAAAILTACRSGAPWEPAALDLLIETNSPSLFSEVVEPLSDAFEPALCAAYAELFCAVVARVSDLDPALLRERYEAIRRPRLFAGEAAQVCVLSRVTLGADLAVTSVLLDAAKKRFPDARIYFAGPAKNFELFNADPRIKHLPAPYQRHGTVRERIAAGLALAEALPAGALLLDPDSRLSQLGLLPLAPPERHLFFESRGYGGASQDSITALAKRWCEEVLGVSDARNYAAVSADPAPSGPEPITVSLGTGGNAAKRVPDPFETELMQCLAAAGRPVLADLGAGGEEEARVQQAITNATLSSKCVNVWKGSFANFASSIAASRLYVGYDSSGQHAAAVFGIPRITIFAGFPNERFLARWQPDGPGASRAIKATNPDETMAQVRAGLTGLL